MYGYDDDDGQDDGDSYVGSSTVQFTPASPGQPWIRPAVEPWHLWGTTQQITQGPILPVPGETGASNTLARIIYKRPETWHWLFSARLVSAQTVGLGDTVTILVLFDLILGVGRSNQRIPAFETLSITYDGPPADPPIGEQVYTTTAVGIRSYARAAGVVTRTTTIIDEITAQDITCSARIEARMGGGIPITSPVVMEVSAHFAPKNHLRPDWFIQGPPEAKFPGSEQGGR